MEGNESFYFFSIWLIFLIFSNLPEGFPQNRGPRHENSNMPKDIPKQMEVQVLKIAIFLRTFQKNRGPRTENSNVLVDIPKQYRSKSWK